MNHWGKTALEHLKQDKTKTAKVNEDELMRIISTVEELDFHLFRTQNLNDLADEMAECFDLHNLSQILQKIAIETGFENYNLKLIRHGSNRTFQARWLSSQPTNWLKRYVEKSYQHIDPVHTKSISSTEWFRFSGDEKCDPIVRDYWQDARDHGTGTNGLCLINKTRGDAIVAVSYITSKTKTQLDELKNRNGYDLSFLTELAVDCFMQVSQISAPSKCPLTDDELTYLYLIAEKSDPKIALEYSPKFGSQRNLQDSIRVKTRAKSIYQAISLASASGWFDELPFSYDEVVEAYPGFVVGESDWIDFSRGPIPTSDEKFC